MPLPTWTTLDCINGLACTNWKRRTVLALDGAPAECIKHLLRLLHHTQWVCDLGWGFLTEKTFLNVFYHRIDTSGPFPFPR